MKLNTVLRHYGGKDKSVPKTARALGLTPACVYNWGKLKYIPYQSQLLIELHSQGKFKARKCDGLCKSNH